MNKQEYRDKLIGTLKRAIDDQDVFPEFSCQVNEYLSKFYYKGEIVADDFVIELRSLYVDVRQDKLTIRRESEKRERRNGLVKRLENIELVSDL